MNTDLFRTFLILVATSIDFKIKVGNIINLHENVGVKC